MQGENAIWDGCQAGISSNRNRGGCGASRECRTSLPTAAYTGGNILRSARLRELLETAEGESERRARDGLGDGAAVGVLRDVRLCRALPRRLYMDRACVFSGAGGTIRIATIAR